MDIEKIEELVTSLVNDKLSEKEREEATVSLKSSLTEAESKIQELASALEEQVGLVSDSNQKLDETETALAAVAGQLEVVKGELDSKEVIVEELKSKVSEYETSTSELSEKNAELASVVEKIEKDKLVADRTKVLDDNKIARAGDAREAQIAKVTEMSVEQFDSYVAELVAFRTEVASTSTVGNNEPNRAAAALNVESNRVDSTLKAKYEAMGKALAKKMSSEYEANRVNK